MNHQPRRIFNDPSTGEAKEKNWEEVWWSASGNYFTKRRGAGRKTGIWRWVRTGSGSRRWIRARSGSEGWGWRNHLPAPIGGKICSSCLHNHLYRHLGIIVDTIHSDRYDAQFQVSKANTCPHLDQKDQNNQKEAAWKLLQFINSRGISINFCQTIYFETLSSNSGRGHHKH